MKKAILALALAFSTVTQANPGDTTWIQANNVKLNYYNNFDTAVAFPNGSLTYRKILMYFTLGEYACPSGSTYCHQWDYTVTNYVMTKTGDTAELSRFITPFATTGTPRFTSSWKQPYIFDVTDYYNLLQDSATIRIFYSGYSGGFTANVKFAFIQGTPPRNVYGFSPLWRGSFTYGNSADPIANHLPAKQFTAPANTVSAEAHLTITGHGSDNNQCCEFAAHSYSLSLNNSVAGSNVIWRSNCGLNELYAQGGTWIYNRGNWCPGDAVNTYTHHLGSSMAPSTTYSLALAFDPYMATSNYGNYAVGGQVLYYGNFNHTVDASLNNIIAPNNDVNYFRENPSNSFPSVRVKNTGSSVINSIAFSYNVKDSAASTFTWNGTLQPLQDTLIQLDSLTALTNLSIHGATGAQYFNVQITAVNGAPDQDLTNNAMQSTFYVAPVWPTKLVFTMQTNTEGAGGNIGAGFPSETTWQITDMRGNVVASLTNDSTSKLYVDTITLAPNQFYQLTINDESCDGLHWWVWDQNPSYGITAGYFYVKKLGSPILVPMNGYVYSGTYNNDFGCQFIQNFTTSNSITGIEQLKGKENLFTMSAYPNPAQDNVTISLNGMNSASGTFEIYDAQGRMVLSQKAEGLDSNIKLNGLSNGVYTVRYKDATTQLHTRMIIVK
ncbi:MAG: T9SS type A sorting domain-containing protein [Bacteroidetes bacterium]|nr:T9SS type A sorting domain-containing protein [Bacteroidota bacterium]